MRISNDDLPRLSSAEELVFVTEALQPLGLHLYSLLSHSDTDLPIDAKSSYRAIGLLTSVDYASSKVDDNTLDATCEYFPFTRRFRSDEKNRRRV